jgi:polyhydroxyalkanoate synthase subunit PhaC
MSGPGTTSSAGARLEPAGEEYWANARRLMQLPFLWERARHVRKGASASEVVYEADHVRVLHYLSDSEPRYSTPLLFVFALVNRPYILDLKPGKSVVEHFVRRGFDTYLIDWGVPTIADRHLGMEDYVEGYLANVVNHLRRRSAVEQISVLGYCMGGTMSAMFTALHPDRVKNLILMAAGIDFATRDGLLNVWTDPRYYDVDRFVDAFGNCPAQFLQAAFLNLKPVQNLIEKPINLFERLDDTDYTDDFLAVETWLNDNIPVAGQTYREFTKYLYQENLLVQGRMPVGRRMVNLRDITCPVLNLMADKDDLVPCAQSLPFNDLVGSQDRKAISFPAGHIGLAIGSRAQKELWPAVCDWLAVRSEPPGAKPTTEAPGVPHRR